MTVSAYRDDAEGLMREDADGGGRFVEVVLRPSVTVRAPEMADAAARLHAEAQRRCFIANSVNFPIRHEARVAADDGPG